MHTNPTEDDRLSPSKISLLILIYLYLRDELPTKRLVLRFLAGQLEGVPTVRGTKLVLLTTLLEFCNVLEESSCPLDSQGSILDLMAEIQYKFLSLSWGIKTADLIQQLSMDAFRYTVEPLRILKLQSSQISSRSPIGRFVRMMAASLKLLQFEESSELVSEFCKYRASTQSLFSELAKKNFEPASPISLHQEAVSEPLFQTWNAILRLENKTIIREKRNHLDDSKFYEMLSATIIGTDGMAPSALKRTNSSPMDSASVHPSPMISVSDLNNLVNEQARLLECFGTPTPEFFKSVIFNMASPQSTVTLNVMPSVHYLQYLEYLRRGEYHEAFDSLHKYFDYMVSQGSKYFYHFALVSKASLHQLFGEDEEALDSMEEAISIARENRDNATLTYVLSWLYDFIRKKPALRNSRIFRQVKNELRLLDYLVKKSLSVSLSLAAISYRFEVEHLINGRCHFSKYYESLFKAGFYAINDNISSFIGVCHTSHKLWKNVGYSHLSQFYNDLGLGYSKRDGSVRDVLIFNMGEAWCNYYLGESELMLPDVKENLELCNSNTAQLKSIRILILLRQIEVALWKGRLRLAQNLLQCLPQNSELDQDCLYEKIRVETLLKLAQGNNSDALIHVSSNITDMNRLRSNLRPSIVSILELNYLKASILIQSNVPLKAFSLIVQQIEIANQLGLRLFVARGYFHMVQILNSSGKSIDAFQLSKSILPLVVSVGNIELTSNVFFELAKAHQQFLEGSEPYVTNSKTVLFANFLNFLSLSISGFKKSVNLGMLVNSFELEEKMAKSALQYAEIRESKPFEDFKKHSQMGLDILRRRAFEECDYGYLKKVA